MNSVETGSSQIEFKIGFITSIEKVELKSYLDSGETSSTYLDLMDLKNNLPNLVIFDSSSVAMDQAQELFQWLKLIPTISGSQLNLNLETFKNLSFQESQRILIKTLSSKALKQNINLCEDLFKYLAHLNELWPNSRSQFFEEFWQILRTNLSGLEVSLIYNDKCKQSQKLKLIPTRMTGTIQPSILENDELAKKLLDNYHHSFTETLEIMEWDEQSGNFVATIKLRGTSVLIMAKLFSLSPLTKGLLTTLMDGLNKRIETIQ